MVSKRSIPRSIHVLHLGYIILLYILITNKGLLSNSIWRCQMEHDEFDLISIDRSMGESRFSQLCGVVLLIALIVGTWLYKKELTGGAKWVIDLF